MQKTTPPPTDTSIDIRELPELRSTFHIPERSAIARLFVEDPGVKGCGWFHSYREDEYHVFANVIRVLCNIIFAPLLVLSLGKAVKNIAYNLAKSSWQDEVVNIPDAVLRNPPGEDVPLMESNSTNLSPPVATLKPVGNDLDGRGNDVYEKTNYEPRWMLQVVIREGQYESHDQVEWTEEHRGTGYTALSYDMEAAYTLFKEAEPTQSLRDPPGGKPKFSLGDRRRIAKEFLKEYCSAIRRNQKVDLDREEFLWLDEFCLSRERKPVAGEEKGDEDERKEVAEERSEELGRLADIFRGADTVVAFCDDVDCDHAKLACRWANRLFTLGEILHANKIQRMTRRLVPGTRPQSYLYPETGRSFRERMMYDAAMVGKWHLHSILRQSNNSGSDTWQMAIHSLIVEAIRRDRESGYNHHDYIGKGLNGLLPRRAKLQHLKGKDGWADLAWLLELNQGFYNQAALAAVCCLPDKPEAGNGWLGPPIEPKAGNERLEPLASAFTVSGMNKGKPIAPLNIVGAQTIGLHPALKRDSMALYRNPHLKRTKIVSVLLLILSWICGFAMLIGSVTNPSLILGGFLMIWLSSIVFNGVRLIIGTMYLERSGWVFLSDRKRNDGSKGDLPWGMEPEKIIKQLDHSWDRFVEWGERQLAPNWDVPAHQYMQGHLVDMRTGIKVRVVVSETPNSMVVLGIHGSGVTYMLLNRSENAHDVAKKVGLVNLPPFTLAVTDKTGSVRVGRGEFTKPVKASTWEKIAAGVDIGDAVEVAMTAAEDLV
ncbi:hypothetical protein VNI00_013829 [Paramarasmius palmivorus]|uniref:Heterokaryon incompatibility domain-containing protein n=1 Tax=Paramarasmius palmivorus TaxID=297713 RepID=A0AAW0BXM4_9AGAR